MKQNPWILASRPKTLVAAAIPVLLGTVLAWHQGFFKPIAALLCLGFAVTAQIIANLANDYFDFIKGADKKDRLGPARMLASGRIQAAQMQKALFGLTTLAFIIGLGLIPYGGYGLISVGALCLVAAYLYTAGPFALAYNGLGDVAVFIFFGLIAVMCTEYVQVGSFSVSGLAIALAIGGLIDNIMVVNNYRDLEEDRAAKKQTLAVLIGRKWTRNHYRANLCLGFILPPVLFFQGFSIWVFALYLLLPLACQLEDNFPKAIEKARAQQQLERTAKFVLMYGFLLSASIILGR